MNEIIDPIKLIIIKQVADKILELFEVLLLLGEP
jgi:hypothetical protein